MDLLATTWMTRSLEEPVASVAIESDGSVVAGGWNGALKRWDPKGELLWKTVLNDRVNDLMFHGNYLIATAGLHLVCVDLVSGTTQWSHALEGSADAALIHEGIVYATSSVYDIEHNDFIESAVWSYELDGTERWVTRMDERPWTIESCDGKVWLGLGRPKCGFATIDSKGTLHHHKGPVDSPITSGSTHQSNLIFGHADGTISDRRAALLHSLNDGIVSLCVHQTGCLAADEAGNLHSFSPTGESHWCLKGDAVEAHSIGFEVEGKPTCWIARHSGLTGHLQVVDITDGTQLAASESIDVRFLSFAAGRMVAGCENGDVHVWETGLFTRRFVSKSEGQNPASNPKKNALQEKLRKLRER